MSEHRCTEIMYVCWFMYLSVWAVPGEGKHTIVLPNTRTLQLRLVCA